MNISLDFPIDKKKELYFLLKQKNFSFKDTDYAFFKAERNGISLTLYKSGKLILQGKDIDEIYKIIRANFFSSKEGLWMGTDEAGKGDYFGPLVVAAVVVDCKKESDLIKKGLKDSKRLSTTKIEEFAKFIRENLPYEVVVISPEEYNLLYEVKGNLNIMLRDAHIEVIKRLLNRGMNIEKVIVDKFSKNSGITDYFKGDVKVEEVVKGEKNIACAASSILARATFEEWLQEMSVKYDFDFPKGAGEKVRGALKLFLQRFSKGELRKVAKLHFKLTSEVI